MDRVTTRRFHRPVSPEAPPEHVNWSRRMNISWIFRTRNAAGQIGASALGFILVLLTLALRFHLSPEVRDPGLVFFVPAILVISSVGGLWAGLFTTLTACVLAEYLLLPPTNSILVFSALELMDLVALALAGGFIALICQFLREAIQRSEADKVQLLHAHMGSQRLAAIVEGSSNAIVSKDLDGIITSWNKASETIFGYSADEAIGAPASLLVPPDLVAEEEKILAEIASGRAIRSFETRRLRKDGTTLEVSLTISPIRDAQGTVIGASKIMRDITEAKQAQENLRRAEERYRFLYESLRDGFAQVDLDGRIVVANREFCRMLGYTTDELSTLTYSDITPTCWHAAEETILKEQVLVRGYSDVYEKEYRRKDGTTFPVELRTSLSRDRKGNPESMWAVVRDISDRKSTEARLQRLRNDIIDVGRTSEIGHVSAGIAHELNQPLSAMLNYSNAAKRLLARGDKTSIEAAQTALSKATGQAERAGEIVVRMRTLIEKWHGDRHIEDINAIIGDAVALETASVQPQTVTIHLSLASELPPIFVDRRQIQHVLAILLRNAFDAVADEPRQEITISSSLVENSEVEVTVADTGPGISRETADRLFMPFFTTKPGRMGIGLVIGQSIVETHGGRISVRPNPYGGTVFLFRLPVSNSA